MIIDHVKFKKIYTCTVCKNEFEWSRESAWFGTVEDIICVACCQECVKKSGLQDDESFESNA